ncbi:TK1 [Callinectes sapidus nudivirus]|nr:TK1 [Callinectes sapidus nudivirus]
MINLIIFKLNKNNYFRIPREEITPNDEKPKCSANYTSVPSASKRDCCWCDNERAKSLSFCKKIGNVVSPVVGGATIIVGDKKDVIWTDLSSAEIQKVLQERQPRLKYNLEQYMNALPKKYLIAYLVGFMFDVYCIHNNMRYMYDDRSHMDHESIAVVNQIRKSLEENESENYYIRICLAAEGCEKESHYYVDLPWNDYIMTNLANMMYAEQKNVLDVSVKPEDKFDRAEIRSIVEKIMKKDPEFIRELKSEQVVNHFLKNTKKVAVSINGTACVGKTSLLNEIVDEVKKRHDPSCTTMKVGPYGGFRGKDSNQILALTYQMIAVDLVTGYPSNVMDRDIFNNLLWRLIMQCMGTCPLEEFIDRVTDLFVNFVSKNLVAIMLTYPVVVLVDFDEVSNRERMFNRGNGGDRFRCFIENYVPSQNVFYCLFACMAKWPVFETAFNTLDNANNRKFIKSIVISKIVSNPKNGGRCNSVLRKNVSFKNEEGEDFTASKKMRIVK